MRISLPALVQNIFASLKQKNTLFQKLVYALILPKDTSGMCFHYLPAFYTQLLALLLPKKWFYFFFFLLIRQRLESAAGDSPPAIHDIFFFFLEETP